MNSVDINVEKLAGVNLAVAATETLYFWHPVLSYRLWIFWNFFSERYVALINCDIAFCIYKDISTWLKLTTLSLICDCHIWSISDFFLYSKLLCRLGIFAALLTCTRSFSNWGMYTYFFQMFSGFETKQVFQMNMCHLSQVLVKTEAVFFIAFKPNCCCNHRTFHLNITGLDKSLPIM